MTNVRLTGIYLLHTYIRAFPRFSKQAQVVYSINFIKSLYVCIHKKLSTHTQKDLLCFTRTTYFSCVIIYRRWCLLYHLNISWITKTLLLVLRVRGARMKTSKYEENERRKRQYIPLACVKKTKACSNEQWDLRRILIF